MTPHQSAHDTSTAGARLTDNRERMAQWLAADRLERSRPSLGNWAVGAAGAVWPLIQGLRDHPSAPLALGVLGQARRRPKTALVILSLAGAAWLLSRLSRPPRQP
jgi:hypothetical protein